MEPITSHLRFALLLICATLQVKCDVHNSTKIKHLHVQDHYTEEDLYKTTYFNLSIPEVRIIMDESAKVNVTYKIECPSSDVLYMLKVFVTDTKVAVITNTNNFTINCQEPDANHISLNSTSVSGNLEIHLKADLVGRTWLMLELEEILVNRSFTLYVKPARNVHKFKVVVIRLHRTIDTIFRVIVYFFVVMSTIGMGCKIELDVVKSVLKKPISPAIGFFCQYLCMPLIAFGIAKLVKFENPAVALGVFACGICPGGGASNIYSYLLGGDVSLSITMTTISNIGALGMVPLWMFTLGQQFKDDKMEIKIPYWDIVQTLATVILPLFIGLAIKYKFQKLAKIIIKVLKPVTFLTVLILLTFGIYANLFIFRLFKPTTLLAGCMLPYIGYLCGGVIGLIFRQPWYRVKTISIETGVQNVMVAYLMLQMALEPPDGDLAAVGPAASACMTPIPLFLLAIGYAIYLKCTNQKRKEISNADIAEKQGLNQETCEKEKCNGTGTGRACYEDV